MFSTQDAAIKWNISLQLLVGTLLPLMALTASVATGGQQAFRVMMTVMYFTVPMFTFYLTNYWIFIEYIKSILQRHGHARIPLAWGLEASFKLSITLFICQFLVYMLLVVMIDYKRAESFRKQDHNITKVI